MRIAIDVRIGASHPTSGIGVFVNTIWKLLNRDPKGNEFMALYRAEGQRIFNAVHSQQRGRYLPCAQAMYVDYFHKQSLLPALLAKRKVNVVFFPTIPSTLTWLPCASIVMIHGGTTHLNTCRKFGSQDLISGCIALALYDIVIPLSVRSTTLDATLTEGERHELVEQWRLDPNRVVVVPLSVPPVSSDSFTSTSSSRSNWADEFRSKFGLRKRVVLAVLSSFIGTKNLSTLIRAYSYLDPVLRTETSLVVVGPTDGWQEIRQCLSREVSGTTLDSIVLTGRLPHRDVCRVYDLADVFVCPSFNEGTSTPTLEGLSYGVPLVVSNGTGVGDIAGEAAIQVSPTDAQGFAHGITRVLENPDLAAELRARALERAKAFSPERQLAALVCAFERAYELHHFKQVKRGK